MFLPSNYNQVPALPGNYMKLEDVANTFRVLSSAVLGYEYWTRENKPVRLKNYPDVQPENIKIDQKGRIQIKHFWAFVVWNYKAKMVQILQVTQNTIQNDILALVHNPKWGDPSGYDITITRSGKDFDTTYSTMPEPHSQIDPAVLNEYKAKNIKLEALFEGGDPFAASATSTTPTAPQSGYEKFKAAVPPSTLGQMIGTPPDNVDNIPW